MFGVDLPGPELPRAVVLVFLGVIGAIMMVSAVAAYLTTRGR